MVINKTIFKYNRHNNFTIRHNSKIFYNFRKNLLESIPELKTLYNTSFNIKEFDVFPNVTISGAALASLFLYTEKVIEKPIINDIDIFINITNFCKPNNINILTTKLKQLWPKEISIFNDYQEQESASFYKQDYANLSVDTEESNKINEIKSILTIGRLEFIFFIIREPIIPCTQRCMAYREREIKTQLCTTFKVCNSFDLNCVMIEYKHYDLYISDVFQQFLDDKKLLIYKLSLKTLLRAFNKRDLFRCDLNLNLTKKEKQILWKSIYNTYLFLTPKYKILWNLYKKEIYEIYTLEGQILCFAVKDYIFSPNIFIKTKFYTKAIKRREILTSITFKGKLQTMFTKFFQPCFIPISKIIQSCTVPIIIYYLTKLSL